MKFVFEISVQWCPSVFFLAHWTGCSIFARRVISVDWLLRRRLEISASLFPLINAFLAETVLTFRTFFSIDYYILTDSAYEMLIKVLFFALLSALTFFSVCAAEVGGIDLDL